MINLTKQKGETIYGVVEYVIDKEVDKDSLPTKVAVGSTAFVIETGSIYMLNGEKEWVKI